ncbi:trypco2 family protein [Abyssibacter profundi]|uniref:trypco2 family protein n=1 Tax=Abyssibacter profundi TaxID=2182787 RepID=UPI0010582F3E|nr:trypco2 family protein [Abyssibacter profundi]
MDLKDFVKDSLAQIAEGIIEANESLAHTDAIINPTAITVNSESSQAYARTRPQARSDDRTRVVEKVDFDIAVTVHESEKTNAGIRVSVVSIGLGAGGESSALSGSNSRIKFTVPMVFPSKRT